MAYGTSELEIASAMSEMAFGRPPLEVFELKGGIPVPVETEFVFEARILPELTDEGPLRRHNRNLRPREKTARGRLREDAPR